MEFNVFLTNLGKYNEGYLVGEWVSLPTTHEELQEVFKRIGIGSKDSFGYTYEEWFITDYDIDIYGVSNLLGEYTNLDELNYLASRLDELLLGELEDYKAILESGLDDCRDIEDLINLTYNIDKYTIYSGIDDDWDLGNMYFQECGYEFEMKKNGLGDLIDYIDLERYGSDIANEEGGVYTDHGYVRTDWESWDREYDDSVGVPEEYRIISDSEDEDEEEADDE